MTTQKPIARFDCTCQEGHMAAEPAGEYVRYDDIKHLLQVEPPSKSDAEFLSLVGHCSNCSCQDCREFFKADARARVEPDWTDANGKRHRYKCGLNPDPAAMKHMVANCTCPPDEPTGDAAKYHWLRRYAAVDNPAHENLCRDLSHYHYSPREVDTMFDNAMAASSPKQPADRKSALDEIVRISEEAGLYDNTPSAELLLHKPTCMSMYASPETGRYACDCGAVNRTGD